MNTPYIVSKAKPENLFRGSRRTNRPLNRYKEKCSEDTKFLTPQANRLALKIQELYQGHPEFLWKKYPGYAIFRNNENKKWYAAIMNILKEKIEKGAYEVEIIDVKLILKKYRPFYQRKDFMKPIT